MNQVHSAGQAAPEKSLATVVYGLQALYFVSGVAMLAAVAINYWKRDEVRGTWLESHFRWQMDTFWRFLIGWTVAIVLMAFFHTRLGPRLADAGFVEIVLPWIAAMVALHGWYVYRIARGWSRLNRAEAMP